MDESPKVAIVFPYFRTRSPMEMLLPSLGAASLAAQLRKLDLNVKIIDCTFLNWRLVQKALRDYHPDIVGAYCMISLTRNTFRLARWVRTELPNSLLVAGGPLPTLYPERFVADFDAIFRGESDLSFPNFCRDFIRQEGTRSTLEKLPLQTYDGLYIRDSRSAVDNPTVHHSEKERNRILYFRTLAVRNRRHIQRGRRQRPAQSTTNTTDRTYA